MAVFEPGCASSAKLTGVASRFRRGRLHGNAPDPLLPGGQSNVTRAAQPSLTRAIKQLEAELGGDLFRRERPAAQLTELGQRMLRC